MSRAPDDPLSTAPPDRQTLRLLERRLADEPLIAATEFEPDGDEPRELCAAADTDRFPPSVEAARLDVRWFTTGDFSIHYVETAADGDRWECRWDRHPNRHNDRCHFHRPPTGDDIVDLELSSTHPIDVLSTVVAALEQRIGQCLERWDADRR